MFGRFIGATAVAALFLVPRAIEPARAAPLATHAATAATAQKIDVDRQPILICDVSGDTWLGPVQSTVLVWSSGDVCFSWEDVDGTFDVGNMKLSSKALNALVSELVNAEAWILQDQWPHVMDVPLHTVTVLDPTTDASAHTFSYWLGHGQYAAVDSVVDRLVQEVRRVR